MAKEVGMLMPPDLVQALASGTMIGVLATFSDDAWPHTTPVQCFYPVNNDTILLSMHKKHTGYQNMIWNKRVMLSFMDGRNLAYKVSGRAGVIKAPSRVHPDMNILRIDVNNVKSDKSFIVRIDKGIQWSFTSWEAEELYQEMLKELQFMSKMLASGRDV